MAIISAAEMRVIEEALGSDTGYVADFTNPSFRHFFRVEVGLDIFDDQYADVGTSKGKRFHSFLEKAPDDVVHKALKKLGRYLRTTGWRPSWRSEAKYADILNRYDGVVERLGTGLQVAKMPEDPTIWLAKVSMTARALSRAALAAYIAAKEGDGGVPDTTKPLLEAKFAALKELLPDEFPSLGNLPRHVHFAERSDCRDIAETDVPDFMAKAEVFAMVLAAKARETAGETDIVNLVDEIFRRKLISTQESDHPDWHALVLQCSVLTVERFRAVTGMQSDEMGAIGKVFSLKDPVLMVPTDLDTETNKSVQVGAMLLFQGFRQFIRNPHAHGVTPTTEDDAYAALMLMTMLLEILAAARRMPTP
ncbi:MAG: hypothetical protein JWO81_2623 [Alphaproteobacteria bacterium]|nr:hypothetical protein [Alphaproteobacteria bacterium]